MAEAPFSRRGWATWRCGRGLLRTTGGSSPRMAGGLIVSYGDDSGSPVPPRRAPSGASSSPSRRTTRFRPRSARPATGCGRRACASTSATARTPRSGTTPPVPLDVPRTGAGRPGGGPGAAPRKSRRADGSTVAAGGRSRIPRTDLAEEGEVRLAGRPVTLRWAVAEDGAVPDADRAPGNVTPVARAFPPATERGRKAPCASDDVGCPGVRSPCTGRDVRVATYRLEANCEASPQISAPALVRTHQRQLTGTCKLFGMPRNRNTEAPRLVVTT